MYHLNIINPTYTVLFNRLLLQISKLTKREMKF
jgi:hypothetical protein